MTVEELKAKFTADTADFKAKLDGMKKQLSEAGNISESLQKTIDKGMKSSSEKTQATSRKLEDMNRKLEEQKAKIKDAITDTELYMAKIDGLKDEYSRQNDEVERQRKVVKSLETAYGKIRSEVEKIGGKDTLSKQLEDAKSQSEILKTQINQLGTEIDSALAKHYKIVYLENEALDIQQAIKKLDELIAKQEEAAGRARQIDSVFASIGENNIKYASPEGMKQLKTEITEAKKEFERLNTQANKTNSQIAQTAHKAANEYKKMETAQTVFNKLKTGAQQLQSKLKSATSASTRLKTAFKDGGSINTVFKKATAAVSGTISKLKAVPNYLKSIASSAKNSSSQFNKIPGSLKKIAGAAAALSLVKGIFGQLRSIVSNYLQQNETLNARVEAMKTAFGQLLAPAIEIVVSAFEKLMPYLLAVGNAIMEVLSSLSIFAGLKETSSAIDGVTSSTNALSKAQSELYGFDKITKQSDDSSSSSAVIPNYETAQIGSIDEIISKITTSINTFMEGIDWESVKSKAQGFAESFSKSFNEMFNGIDWALAGKTVAEGLNTITTSINTFVDGVKWGDIGSDIASSLNSMVSNIDWDGVGKTFSAKWKILTDTMKTAIEEFDFRNLGSGIGTAINSWFDNISWGDVSGNISGAIAGVFETIAETLENIDWQSLATDTAEFLKGIEWGDMASSLFESLGAALGGIGSYIGELLSMGWQNFTDYWDQYIDWGDTPGEIIAGLFEGLKNAITNIGTWIKDNIFTPFIEGFKKAFGIASPAKEMKPMGGYIVDGIKEGLGNIWEKVKEKFTNLLTGITTWFTEKKATIKQSWNNFTSDVKDKTAVLKAKAENVSEKVLSTLKSGWSTVVEKTSMLTAKAKNTNKDVLSTLKSGWNTVVKKTSTLTAKAKNTNKDVLSTLKSGWNTVVKKTSTLTAKAENKNSSILSTLKSGWETVTDKAAVLKANAVETGNSKLATLKGYWDGIKTKTEEFSLSLKDGFSTVFNGVLTSIVNMINKVIEVLNKLPGVEIDKVKVPQFAKGGIIDGPTLAMVGEAGKEAVMPLENNTGWISVLAGQIVQLMSGMAYSGSGNKTTVVIPIYIGSKKISEVVIDDINKQTDATGRCPIKI